MRFPRRAARSRRRYTPHDGSGLPQIAGARFAERPPLAVERIADVHSAGCAQSDFSHCRIRDSTRCERRARSVRKQLIRCDGAIVAEHSARGGRRSGGRRRRVGWNSNAARFGARNDRRSRWKHRLRDSVRARHARSSEDATHNRARHRPEPGHRQRRCRTDRHRLYRRHLGSPDASCPDPAGDAGNMRRGWRMLCHRRYRVGERGGRQPDHDTAARDDRERERPVELPRARVRIAATDHANGDGRRHAGHQPRARARSVNVSRR